MSEGMKMIYDTLDMMSGKKKPLLSEDKIREALVVKEPKNNSDQLGVTKTVWQKEAV